MKKVLMVAALAAAGGGFLTLGGCSDDSGQPVYEEKAFSAAHSDHLALIPGDTLFYMGSLEPVAVKDMIGSMASLYQLADPTVLGAMNQQTMDELLGKAETPGAKFAVSLLNFFMQGISDPIAMFSATGAKDTLFSSVYSVGLMPVIRYEADKTGFDAFIAKLEAEAGVTAVNKELNGVSYRTYALTDEEQKSLDLVVTHHGGDAIFTVAMSEDGNQQNLAVALGQEKPTSSLRDTGAVVKMKNDYGYLPDSLGYVSFKEIISALTSSDNLAGQTLAALDQGDSEWFNQMRSPACAAEFSSIADVWPRVVTGYRSMDYSDAGFSGEFHMNLEINHQPLTSTLQKIRGHIPTDLTSGIPQIFSMAVGLDMSKINEVLGELAGYAQGLQYECSLLQALNGMEQGINQARPMIAMSTGMASGLKGIRISLFDIDGDVAAGQVTDVDAMISVSGEQVPSMVNMMMAMGGGAGMVTIPADGTPVALPLPPQALEQTAADIQPMVAMNQNQAVIYVGETAASQYQKVLDEKLNSDGLMFFSMDYGKYMKLLSGVMDASLASNDMSDEDKAELVSFSEAIKNIDYQEEVMMEFTERGVEFSGKIEMHNP